MKSLSVLLPATYYAVTLTLLKLAVYQGNSHLFEWGPRIPEMSSVWPLLAAGILALIGFLVVRKLSRQEEVKKSTVAAEPAAAATS